MRVGGETWSAIGSLTGGEVSHKLNREVVLLVDAPAVYSRLAEPSSGTGRTASRAKFNPRWP